MKTLNGIFQQSFRKIRITSKQKETNVSNLFDRRFDLKEKQKTSMENDALEDELKNVENEIAKGISKENRDKVITSFKAMAETFTHRLRHRPMNDD